jgi:hypothetical protein
MINIIIIYILYNIIILYIYIGLISYPKKKKLAMLNYFIIMKINNV